MPELEKIDIPFNDFETMLSQNSKILFSGIFGSGKTTFLNDFFKDNEEYESIYIYPVNYAVVSNKDIFELIKHDVLLKLIGKVSKEDFDKLEIPYHLTLWTYLMSGNDFAKKVDFLASFLNFAGTHGKAFLKVYEQIKSLKDGFIKFHEQFQEDDFTKVEEYLNSVTTEKSHVYEEDFYTDLIRNLIDKIKETTEKKVVLVIDDLDRLDPEHIFRILNIFSAHIDFRNKESDNKFDFDKVIIVCDYNNIGSVFHHKYGANADFNGYIDKFYNTIYWYNSSFYIEKIINDYLNNIDAGNDKNLFNDNNIIGFHIDCTLKALVLNGLINFRQLVRFDNDFDLSQVNFKKKSSHHIDYTILNRNTFYVEYIIYFYLNFFKNKHELKKVIDRAKNISMRRIFGSDCEIEIDYISELLFLINYKNYKLGDFIDGKLIEIKYSDYFFECETNLDRKSSRLRIECINVYSERLKDDANMENSERIKVDKEFVDLNYFSVLNDAIKVYSDYIKYNF